MTFERLATLSDTVKTTFQPAFIFLVFPDKVQHFPARDWTTAQFHAALEERLGKNYTFQVWEGMVIALSNQTDVIAVLPKFREITELRLKKIGDS
ncbi:hypothetical protein ACFQOY_11730 [Enterococcus alcedinis]|uniref:Uncharacterized protein n=1 Tax=Enterococcus alcedinis TaxID=1274384 RepID=A0A917N7D2_9ENTE|nr:hypothetical protein [Enterococcus alcedinis]MBP2103178.1 hypothetical protein [Enterococcus alcedinis]GGI66742.1 hypothetical protein GCM10011482_23960 [Enterococcus alcedinis]